MRTDDRRRALFIERELVRTVDSIRSFHTDFARRANQSFRRFLPVQPYLQKYFCFSEMQIRLSDSASRLTEGRLEIVTDARRDAVDADGAPDEGA
jgi:hypothetical protein